MEPNQVHPVAAAVSCDSQQIIHTLESRLTGQIVGDVSDGNRRNRIHDDVALVHAITATCLYMGTRPDANAASDSSAPDALSKAFGEYHVETHPMATSQLTRGALSCRAGTIDRCQPRSVPVAVEPPACVTSSLCCLTARSSAADSAAATRGQAVPFAGSFAADVLPAFGVRFRTSSRSTSASTFWLSTTTETHLPS